VKSCDLLTPYSNLKVCRNGERVAGGGWAETKRKNNTQCCILAKVKVNYPITLNNRVMWKEEF